jgi:GNAT superfamily N-acetyltransferase
MDLRPLDASSEAELAQVLALFRLVFGREMSPEFYRWRFLDNPFGPPMVSLLWDGPVLAGHYAASAMRAYVDGERLGAQSMTTMTHPDYRGKGVFPRLAEHLYASMAAQGAALIWGLPNVNSHFSFVRKLGWRNVGVLVTMTKAVDDASPPSNDALPEVAIGDDVTRLFQESLDGRIWASVRDARYMRWRYVDNPTARYRCYSLAGGSAFVVVKEYPTPAGVALEVVDYLYGNRPDALGEALGALLAAARGRYAMVRTWMSLDDPAFGSLEKLGFVPKEPLAYFGGRALGSFAVRDDAWNLSRWRITMGDSDNY